MAIRTSVNARQGFVAPQAYVKVDSFFGNNQSVGYHVRVYYNTQARNDEAEPIWQGGYSFPYVPGMTDPLVACYNHLKTLPEYSNGQDV